MTNHPTTALIELTRSECDELLTSSVIGRLGVLVDGRPEVYPVCHVYVDGSVAFPTNAGTKLHAALSWPFVAFEVDAIEPDGLSGWSVIVKGRAEEVTEAAEIERLSGVRTVAWRSSGSEHWIRIESSEVSGRRIEAVTRPYR